MKITSLFMLFVVMFTAVHSVNALEKRKTTDMVVIHHSETDGGNVEIFRKFHVEANGWEDIGYHFVITNGHGGSDGKIQVGRAEDLKGAHAGKATGRNSHSIGVCLVGSEVFTDAQIASLVDLLVDLCRKYNIKPGETTIQRHHDKCPGSGLDLGLVIKKVRSKL